MTVTIPEIKHLFFVYRNGELADTLRKAGMPYKVIFGLQVPQIAEIARSVGQDPDLAEMLWNDINVRESRLLATYLFPPEMVDFEKAVRLTRGLTTREEADMLAFRLLRRLPEAEKIADAIEKDSSHPLPYAATALRRHLDK